MRGFILAVNFGSFLSLLRELKFGIKFALPEIKIASMKSCQISHLEKK